MLVALCALRMLEIITVGISDFQELNDLLVFYNECQEHELERYIARLLFVLYGSYILKPYACCPRTGMRLVS